MNALLPMSVYACHTRGSFGQLHNHSERMKYLIQWARWRVPSEDRAFEGKLEGRITPAERVERYAEVARLRKNWKPCPEAWSQIQDLEPFIG